jgi:hypothetical protein
VLVSCPFTHFTESATIPGLKLFVCSLPKDKKLVELKTQASCVIKMGNRFSSLLIFRDKRTPDPKGIRNSQYKQVQFPAIIKSQQNKIKQNIIQHDIPSLSPVRVNFRSWFDEVEGFPDS